MESSKYWPGLEMAAPHKRRNDSEEELLADATDVLRTIPKDKPNFWQPVFSNRSSKQFRTLARLLIKSLRMLLRRVKYESLSYYNKA